MNKRWAFLGFLGLAFGGTAQPAFAQFVLCNKSPHRIEAAFAYRTAALAKTGEGAIAQTPAADSLAFTAQGWWFILPSRCATLYPRPLDQRFYYYYARAIIRQPGLMEDVPVPSWRGEYLFCTDSGVFDITRQGNCELRGYTERGFAEADTGGKTSLTVDIE